MKRISLAEFQPREWTPLPKTRQCCPTQNTPASPHAESCTLRASWGLRKAPAYTLVAEPKPMPAMHDEETCNKASSGECLCRYRATAPKRLPRAGSLPTITEKEELTAYANGRIALEKRGRVKFCASNGRAALAFGIYVCIHDPNHAGPHVDRAGFEWAD